MTSKYLNLSVTITTLTHILFDPNLFNEFNVERFELGRTGKLLFNHPQGTHYNRFWALTLAVYSAESSEPPGHPPMARTI